MTPNFSTTQPSGALTSFVITDTSASPDLTVTGRLITIRKIDGSYLVPSGSAVTYIFWAAANSSMTVSNILDKDYCVEITVTWYIGSTVGYTKTIITLFIGYTDLFLRQLTQALSVNKMIISQYNFWLNKNKLRVLLDDAEQAVLELNDQTIAQFCLDEAKKLTDNINTFF